MLRAAVRTIGRVAGNAKLNVKPFERSVKCLSVMPAQVGFQSRSAHDLRAKGDQELLSFLSEEIATEQKSLKPVGKALDEFQVKAEDSVLTFTKNFNGEKIIITLNVNHSVDAEQVDESAQQGEEGDVMKSKPNFDVDIVKTGQTLTFSCSFVTDEAPPADSQEEYNDIFVINEISLYEGECKDETYAVAGDILDGYLYDLFMNMLEERGVTNEFVDKLSQYTTSYEHSLYVQLLSKLSKFVQSK